MVDDKRPLYWPKYSLNGGTGGGVHGSGSMQVQSLS